MMSFTDAVVVPIPPMGLPEMLKRWARVRAEGAPRTRIGPSGFGKGTDEGWDSSGAQDQDAFARIEEILSEFPKDLPLAVVVPMLIHLHHKGEALATFRTPFGYLEWVNLGAMKILESNT